MPLANLLLVLISLALSAAMIEFGSWAWAKFVRPHHPTQWEFRATRPPPYQGADYFSDDFLRESEAVIRGRLTDVLELNDFRGRYFNVRHGYRVTTDAPQNPSRRVLMFGGSTLFAQEVPDQFTIPSILQRMLNAQGVSWQVLNFGLHGMNAAQQTKILRLAEIRENDIVVFYHGVNDIYYLVFGGYREGWVHGTPAFRPVQKLSALHKMLYSLHQRLKDYSYTAEVALDIFQRGRPSTVTDPGELARNLDIAANQFRVAVADAAELSDRAGASFVHFLQPQVFAAASMTPYEQMLVANPLLTAPGVETAFRQGYPRLREVSAEMARQDIAYFDISRAFDARTPGEEILLDFCHINHAGNALVAQQMFERYFLAQLRRDQAAYRVRRAARSEVQSGSRSSR